VAVSGGADSIHLLETLAKAARGTGQALIVLHVDHGVRGASGRADARFVAARARELKLPCRVLAADPTALFKNGRASEGRLRGARYALLDQALSEFGARALYTAHTFDDQLECIVLAALRGAGLRGLSGMRRRRRLRPEGPWLVRPYLMQRGQSLREELSARGRAFRRDPTNRDLSYLRNQVRHQFLPELRAALGPDLDRKIVRLGRLSRLLWRRARRQARDLSNESSSDAMHAALVRAAGSELSRGLSAQMQRLLQKGGRAVVPLGPGRALRIGAGSSLEPVLSGHADRRPPRIEIRLLRDQSGRLHRIFQRLDREQLREKLERRGRIYLDADRVALPLCVRGREPGDRFQPLGWRAPGRLKRQLNARKLPPERRDELVLFASRAGLSAVEGLPPGEQAAVSARTRRLLRITIRRMGRTGRTGRT